MTIMFVTRNDIIPSLLRIEKMHDIQYVSESYHTEEQIPTYYSALDIPNIGIATSESLLMSNSYIIMPKNSLYHTDISHRYTPHAFLEYHINISKNLDFVSISFGGLYPHKNDNVFIGSGIVYFRGATEKAKELYRPYGKYLTRSFVTIKDWRNRPWKVGPEALELLRNGMRFITDNDIYDHPDYRHHDLQLPEKYK